VLSFAELAGGARLLESGAGTGKATRLFAPYLASNDWTLTAVEPDPAMAALLRVHLADEIAAERLEVRIEGLEAFADAAGPGNAGFDLLYAAQSWHWVDASRRAELAATLLRPGGTVALIWNIGAHPEPGVQEELTRVYEALAPSVNYQPLPSLHGGTSAQQAVAGQDYERELADTGRFTPLETARESWSATYDTAAWTTLLQTHSDHRLLEPAALERVLEEVAAVIDRFGGSITCHYEALALLARRLG
jgi:SAM-dependent methyltransferase